MTGTPQNFGVGAVLDALSPHLAEMSQQVVREVLRTMPTMTPMPATVMAVAANGVVTVEPDDARGAQVPAFSWVGLPAVGARVMLLYYPPNGLAVVGYATAYRNPRRVGGKFRRAAAQSIPNVTLGTISWDTEDEDSDGFVVADALTATAFRVPTGLGGRYLVTGIGSFGVVTGAARSFMELAASNYAQTYRCPIGIGDNASAAAGWFDMPDGTTFGMNVFQSTGGAQNINGATIQFYRVPD